MMNVQFSVRGRTFNVRTEDGELLKKIAEELDQKINAQAAVARKLDEPSLAIITALDMLHEAALEKQQLANEVLEIQNQLDAVMTLLDSLLPTDSDGAEPK
jgi:cell division protein ZapA (FtsZ GTPase activity inhibitor)